LFVSQSKPIVAPIKKTSVFGCQTWPIQSRDSWSFISP